MKYGKAIKTIRAARGLQQRELAQMLGLDSSYISLLENGRRTPSLQVVEALAATLRVPTYLILLLASEDKDLQGLDANHAQQLGAELLKALIRTFPK